MAMRSAPKKRGHAGNYCAYCYYWGGDVKLHSYSYSNMEFDVMAKGYCVCNGRRCLKNAGSSACNDFELSYEAKKFAI